MVDSGSDAFPTLYVEGAPDFFFVEELRSKYGIASSWQTKAKNGFPSVMRVARDAVVRRGTSAVGILVDTDSCLSARWDEIDVHFKRPEIIDKRAISLPDRPCSNGTIIEQDDGFPRIGIWLMPNNASPGELENFVVDMVPRDNPIWPRAENYIDGIQKDLDLFEPDKTDRAKLYAWLATCKKPPYIGSAISNGELEWQVDNCQTFVDWLERLFRD